MQLKSVLYPPTYVEYQKPEMYNSELIWLSNQEKRFCSLKWSRAKLNQALPSAQSTFRQRFSSNQRLLMRKYLCSNRQDLECRADAILLNNVSEFKCMVKTLKPQYFDWIPSFLRYWKIKCSYVPNYVFQPNKNRQNLQLYLCDLSILLLHVQFVIMYIVVQLA